MNADNADQIRRSSDVVPVNFVCDFVDPFFLGSKANPRNHTKERKRSLSTKGATEGSQGQARSAAAPGLMENTKRALKGR